MSAGFRSTDTGCKCGGGGHSVPPPSHQTQQENVKNLSKIKKKQHCVDYYSLLVWLHFSNFLITKSLYYVRINKFVVRLLQVWYFNLYMVCVLSVKQMFIACITWETPSVLLWINKLTNKSDSEISKALLEAVILYCVKLYCKLDSTGWTCCTSAIYGSSVEWQQMANVAQRLETDLCWALNSSRAICRSRTAVLTSSMVPASSWDALEVGLVAKVSYGILKSQQWCQ